MNRIEALAESVMQERGRLLDGLIARVVGMGLVQDIKQDCVVVSYEDKPYLNDLFVKDVFCGRVETIFKGLKVTVKATFPG